LPIAALLEASYTSVSTLCSGQKSTHYKFRNRDRVKYNITIKGKKYYRSSPILWCTLRIQAFSKLT
jgi:hypothetical protein